MSTLLVVDDDPEVCSILAEALGKGGYKVVQAAHVSEANAKLGQQRFDCILTDLYLGKGDGGQLIASLRLGRGLNCKTPVLLMSAHLEIGVIKKLRPMVSGVLVKPFDMKTLLSRISEVLGLEPQSQAQTKAA